MPSKIAKKPAIAQVRPISNSMYTISPNPSQKRTIPIRIGNQPRLEAALSLLLYHQVPSKHAPAAIGNTSEIVMVSQDANVALSNERQAYLNGDPPGSCRSPAAAHGRSLLAETCAS